MIIPMSFFCMLWSNEKMTTIVIMNQKGGVGKTTSTLNLSAAIYNHGGSPIMIDMDPQAHLTSIHSTSSSHSERSLFDFYQNNHPLEELTIEWERVGKLIRANKALIKVETSFGKGPSILNRLKNGLSTLENTFPESIVLIDSSPNLGVLSLSALFASDLVLIPISSDFLSINGAKKITQTLDALEPVLKRRVNRRYLLTKFDKRRRMSEQVLSMANTYFGNDVLNTVINENVELAKSSFANKDIFSHNKHCIGALNYDELYRELLKQECI